jgi:molybdopterin-binding protein
MLRTKTINRKAITFLRLISIFLILIPLFPYAGVSATTLQRLSIDQLTAGSDAVARVNFSGTESRWENGTIWTVTTLRVVEIIKGTLPAEISVRLPGGRVGHLTATVEGTPRFHAGDDAIVFLKTSPAGGFSVAGWVQGTFRVSRDPRTGVQSVTQDSSAFAVFDSTTRSFRTEGIHRMPVEEFRGRVASAIARSTGRTR